MKLLISALVIVWLFVLAIAHAAENIWCRGPVEFRGNATALNIYYRTMNTPAGKKGGKLKPGYCGYENSSGLSARASFQIIFSPTVWKEEPWTGFLRSAYIQLLSNPDYVVFLGQSGQQNFDYKSIWAIPFKKDPTRGTRAKKFSR